ncbi:MAG: SLC13 family permease [Planctomycetota bacterium]
MATSEDRLAEEGADCDGAEVSAPRVRSIGGVLGVCGFFFCLMWPGLPLDLPQRKVAAVTALTATLWITVAVPVGASSLLPAVLFPILGVIPAKSIGAHYMQDLVFLFLGAFVIALGLERWGVHRRIALFLLSRIGASPRRLVLGFMVATAFLSLWINNTAATLLMLPIATATLAQACEGLDDPRARRHLSWCLLLGVAYSASVGGVGTLVGTAPNQVFLGQFAARFPGAKAPTFGEWFLGWMPLVLLFIPLAWWFLTAVMYPVPRQGGAALEVVRAERAAAGPMSVAQRRMAALFALAALAWVFRADLRLGDVTVPGWVRLVLGSAASDPAYYAAHRDDLSDATVALALACLAFVIPAGGAARGPGGERVMLMDWRTAGRLPWDVLLLLGAGFCLAYGFKVTQLDAVFGRALAPLFEGRSTWVIVAGVALLVSFLTEVTSNTATTAVLMPVLGAAAVEAGLHPLLVMTPATIAASAAFMLPVATPPNAVVFASRRVPAPVMARAGFVLNLLAVALVTLVFQLWVRRVWGIGQVAPEWAQ